MMYFSSLIGKFYVNAKGFRKSILRFILLKLLGDPDIEVDIRGKKLIAPASHKLPSYVAEFPFYDELVSRLGNYLREKSGYLTMIDVGANIGDTIVASNNSDSDMFLAVEANPKFISYLKRNCENMKNLHVVEAFLTSRISDKEKFSVLESRGTARISPGGNKEISVRTLDSIIFENPEYREFNFLKIDTDGHDFRVIDGGKNCISHLMPSILFESDVFDSENYLIDLQKSLSFFGEIGYSLAMVYDNFGNLFGAYSLDDLGSLKFPLFYQLTSPFYYFDILLMRPELAQDFLERELSYFSAHASSELLKRLAREVQSFPFSLR